MKRTLLFQIYSFYVIQALFSYSAILARSTMQESWMQEAITLAEFKVANASRNILVEEMLSLENPLMESVQLGDNQQTESLLNRLKTIIWPQIVDQSLSLIDASYVSHRLPYEYYEDEEQYQSDLKKHFTRLLFIAKDRICESPDETFYKPMNQCLPFPSYSEPCPEFMMLLDGSDNLGFCDCISSPAFLFSLETELCYIQNTQGPCQDGEWFILEDRNPVCQSVPEGCLADGQHVYWSQNMTLEKQCWKLGTQGPCPLHQTLISNGGLDVFCGVPFGFASGPDAPLRDKTTCQPGSFKNQKRKCVESAI